MKFIKELFTMKEDNIKIGLSQFKGDNSITKPEIPEVSIRTKNVKLSDLMRRAS